MGKLLKPGRVVVVLSGRMAGKKAVVVQAWDNGTKERSFGHCLVCGVERAPLKVTKKMSKKKIEKRCRVKPFVKYVNFNHLMPTRYTVPNEFETKSLITDQQMSSPEERKTAKKTIRNVLYEKFMNPTSDKTGKISKDVVFMRKKLRF
eukprot:GHVS01019824.1.p1 GENE.GHVS01019824.1~~GHVS01019824.1.p1  ORF type:complete len:148 (-),score=11.30 GHVS01019824.1:204-647(-)